MSACKISLTLESKENALHGISLYESTDVDALDSLIGSKGILKDSVKKHFAKNYKNEMQMLDKYRSLVKNDKVKVSYHRVKGMDFGRVNPDKGLSLFVMRKALRHTLAKDFYTDIDIENCHPSILLQICKQHNIPCEALSEYVNNREYHLQDVMAKYGVARKKAKDLFISLMNCGGFNKWLEEASGLSKDKADEFKNKQTFFIKKFYFEMKKIAQTILANNPLIAEQVNKHKTSHGIHEYNKPGSVISYYLQEIECRILEAIFLYCVQNGFIKKDDAVLCADGIMIRNELFQHQLLNTFHDIVLETFGISINFTVKDMDEAIPIEDIEMESDDDTEVDETDSEVAGAATKETDEELWKMFEKNDQAELAEYYHSKNPNKYLRSELTGWYEYNHQNRVMKKGKEAPASMLNHISEFLHNTLSELKNRLQPDPKDQKEFDRKMKLYRQVYVKVGTASFVRGIIDYLKFKYTIDRLDDKIDANPNILGFDDKVYDVMTGQFRDIKPDDYLTKSCKYNAPTQVNVIRDEIRKILLDIFGKQNVAEYWLTTTSLALFTNKLESVYIHTGAGGNGKGVLSDFVKSAIGEYFMVAENSFLTSSFRAGQANPTLANCNGVRYLLVSEPDNGTKSNSINVDFVKSVSGGDEITCRALYSDNKTFKPQFTVFMQCNSKPSLGKLDNGIQRRLKIIDYPFSFVDAPNKPYEKMRDYSLKQKLTQQIYIDQFILLLLDTAHANIHKDIKSIQLPDEVKEQISEYIEENNPIKAWLDEHMEITNQDKDRIKASDALMMYNSNTTGEKMTAVKFSEYMKFNQIDKKKSDGIMKFVGIKAKPYPTGQVVNNGYVFDD
jgi:P4 family phage/plasmid primase-like protien